MKKVIFLFAILFATFTSVAQVATKAAQDTGNTKLNTIRLQGVSSLSKQDTAITKLNAIRLQSVSNKTVVVSSATISSSSLPTGAATSALQTTQNTNITNLRTDVQNCTGAVDLLNGPLTDIKNNIGKAESFVTSFSVVPASAGCTDLVEFKVSAATARVRKIVFSGYATTAIKVPVTVRFSNGNSGGTSTTKTPVSLVSNGTGGSSSAIIKVFTANPTVGSSGGDVYNTLLPLSLVSTSENSTIIIEPSANGMYPFWVTGGLYWTINLNNTAIVGGVIYITIFWDEG